MKRKSSDSPRFSRIRKSLKIIFGLNTAQANGLMVLLPLLFAITLSEPAWRWWSVRHWQPDPRDAAKLDSLSAAWRLLVPAGDADTLPTGNASRLVYFRFDPNTATPSQFVSLGFKKRTAQTIENFRKKGGVFRSKEDLLKVYGMDSSLYEKVKAYVFIGPGFRRKQIAARPHGNDVPPPNSGDGRAFSKQGRGPQKNEAQLFDINLADSARLMAVWGIGEKLSRRIIKYRSSLGGFVSVGQLGEIWGLDSAVVRRLMKVAFVAPDFLPDRIDLNTADEKTLDAHPYVGRQEARAIVAYRFQHGQFRSISELRRIPVLNEEKIRRLEPYLKCSE